MEGYMSMNKKLLSLILILSMALVMIACGKKTDGENEGEEYIGEELLSNVEKSRLSADKSKLSELAYSIRISLVEGYSDVDTILTPVRVDSEGRIEIARLFDTSTEEGKDFVKAVCDNLGAEYIKLSSKLKEDCTVRIGGFDEDKGEFTINVESVKCGMKFDINHRGNIQERS